MREFDDERRAHAGFTVERDLTFVRVNEFAHDVQAEAEPCVFSGLETQRLSRISRKSRSVVRAKWPML